MKQLPYIDEHAEQLAGSPDHAWRALLVTLRRAPNLPGWLAAAWGLQQSVHTGAPGAEVAVGDALPGFVAAEVDPPYLLTLRGHHRFSDYELRFEFESLEAGGTRLRAKSSADFPGLKGWIYRTLVVGSGGHRVAVRRILARVKRTAERSER